VADQRWYLLIHQLPTKPIYLRARIGHRLARAGALALKNSVYVLPGNPENLEVLGGIVQEARAAGGAAYVSEAEFVDGITSEELIRRFRDERDVDYAALSVEARGATDATAPARLARLQRRQAEIEAIDFFDASGRKRSKALLATLEKRRNAPGKDARTTRKGRVWATRRGVQIDRIASAWLIRRFIDPAARFRFIDPKSEPVPGELRFDMVGGDFTHEGDSCTFETLVRTIRTPDPALGQIAEIVHDVDLKDQKFGRADAPGIQQIVLGIVLDCPRDEDRLQHGFALFDDLYASFRRRAAGVPSRSKTRRGNP
jgi:hypothetical protein